MRWRERRRAGPGDERPTDTDRGPAGRPRTAPLPEARQIIAHDLVGQITARQAGPGLALPPEAEMVKAYGVGRATLREALRLLEVQGLLSMWPGPGGGPVVSTLGAADFARVASLYLQVSGATKGEIIAARVELEACMARLAAEAQDPAGLAALRSELELAAAMRLDDDLAFQRLSSSFHMTVAGISATGCWTSSGGASRPSTTSTCQPTSSRSPTVTRCGRRMPRSPRPSSTVAAAAPSS